MIGRTHFILIATLSGAIAVVAAGADFVAWRMRWPIDVTWASIPLMLLWPTVIGYQALWRPGVYHLFAFPVMALIVAVLLTCIGGMS